MLDPVFSQRGGRHVGIAVFGQVFKAGSLDRVEVPKQDAGMDTGHEERTGLVGQCPHTGSEGREGAALIRNVGDGHHKPEVLRVGACIERLGGQHERRRQQPKRNQRGDDEDRPHLVQMVHWVSLAMTFVPTPANRNGLSV